MGLSHSPRIVTDGLVFCVDAANKRSYPGAGTTWTDLTANKNNGTLTNGPTFDSANGGSIVFDGTDDIVVCGATNAIIGNNPAAVSLTTWFKTDNNTTDFYLASLKRLSATSTLLSITINQQPNSVFAANYLGFLYDIGDTGGDNGSGHKWLVVNNSTFYSKWNYIVATVDVNAATLYLNGIQIGQNTSDTFNGPNRSDPSNDFTIGAFSATSPVWTDGNISQVKVYNKVLSEQEIKQNYLATKGRYV
jgi:hypothetical protein